MPDCDYCSDTFDDEGTYYKHLDSEHADDLGSIDQRRVDEYVDGDSGFRPPIGPLILVGVIGFGLVLIVYLTVFMGNDSTLGPSGTVNEIDVAATPTDVGSYCRL